MSSIYFLYKGDEIIIPCNIKEKLAPIVKRFCAKIRKNREKLIFLCQGGILDLQMTEDQIHPNIDNKKYIQVHDNVMDAKDEDIYIKSNIIICPKCQENASILFQNYKISLSNCKNGHNIDNIKISDFPNTQKVNLSKIICGQCKENNMGTAIDHIFFRCTDCKKNLCSLCKYAHDPKHNIIIYSNKFYTCDDHGESFTSYCFKCKMNLCFICEKEKHSSHIVKSFNQMDNNDDKNKLYKKIKKFREKIDNMKMIINNIINICNKVIDSYEIFYNINKDIYDNINIKYRNIQKLKNQEFINNEIEINNELDSIIKEKNIESQFSKILKIYSKLEDHNYDNINSDNSILIQYKIDEKRIKIFGNEFVKNNKNKCKMKICNIEYEITAEYNAENYNNNKLEIKLIGIDNITDASHMFNGCRSLSSLPDISNWNTSKITNMSDMFYDCSSLSSLPDISNWNTSKVTNMSCMLNFCKSLSTLPDISKWNTNKVTDMKGMFCGCSSLTSLPNISNWNTNNVTDMKLIFYLCSSLSSLPDISKWKTNNVTDMSCMFYKCSFLSSLPDISNWNTSKVTDMSEMFEGCLLLSSLPDISKWNTINVTNIMKMFCGCSSLISLPDISIWNTKNVTNISYMFNGCSSLSSLPDISKWNTINVTSMSFMFMGCSSLSSLPDISKWNTFNVINMLCMFSKCPSLSSLPDITKWNTSNANRILFKFYFCYNLILPKVIKQEYNI